MRELPSNLQIKYSCKWYKSGRKLPAFLKCNRCRFSRESDSTICVFSKYIILAAFPVQKLQVFSVKISEVDVHDDIISVTGHKTMCSRSHGVLKHCPNSWNDHNNHRLHGKFPDTHQRYRQRIERQTRRRCITSESMVSGFNQIYQANFGFVLELFIKTI